MSRVCPSPASARPSVTHIQDSSQNQLPQRSVFPFFLFYQLMLEMVGPGPLSWSRGVLPHPRDSVSVVSARKLGPYPAVWLISGEDWPYPAVVTYRKEGMGKCPGKML